MRATGGVLALALAPPSSAEQIPTYRVTPLSFDLSTGDNVGAKRSGALCLPAGSIAWRDAKPDAAEARDAIARGAKAAGLRVGAADNPFEQGMTSADRAISVRVRSVHLSACVPPGGLGRLMNRSHMVKGEGLIAVEWRVYARGQDDAVATVRTCTGFTYRGDPGTLADMTLEGLRSAAARFAADLETGASGQSSIEDEACRRLRLPGAAASVD